MTPRHRPMVVVTRDEAPDGPLASALTAGGADVFVFPTIAIEPAEDLDALDNALSDRDGYDWIIFTSAHAVDAVCARPAWQGRVAAGAIPPLPRPEGRPVTSGSARGSSDALTVHIEQGPHSAPAPMRDTSSPATGPLRVAAVGAATATRLAERGVAVDLLPSGAEAPEPGLEAARNGARQGGSGDRHERRLGGEGAAGRSPEVDIAPNLKDTTSISTGAAAALARAIIASYRESGVASHGANHEASQRADGISTLSAGRHADGTVRPGAADRAHPSSSTPANPLPLAGVRILWPRSDIAGREMSDLLAAAGAEIVAPVAYRTVPGRSSGMTAAELRMRLDGGGIDAITFMSPSSARGLAAALGVRGPDGLSGLAGRTLVASIGPSTSETLRELGAPPDVESPARNAVALARALLARIVTRQEARP